ncbi:AMP-binding protein [Virgibacillus doumboii]|uniref:AMP-binding protein n=1 Tax=Virgibacillus doumboii TaxID=2697503 RepID=UPI0013E0A2DA|nr:AMP-binding protein [Virgibacillus doumboii]
MKVFRLIYVLYKIKLLFPTGLYRLIKAISQCGINLMTLLHVAETKYANQVALVDDYETINYKQLLEQSNKLAGCLKDNVKLQSGQKVALLCKNHASLVKSIFAVSRLGADLYLLNTEMSEGQFNELVNRHDFDVLIYDDGLSSLIEQSPYSKFKVLSYHTYLPAISNFLNTDVNENTLPRTSAGKIILQTSGTTGVSKDVPHKPSIFNYLNPFATFIKRLKVLNYNTAYIATPIYHGYGIAVLLLFIPLGKKTVISSGFDAKKACRLIREHHADVITVVPLMLEKMLQTDPQALKSLSCIASGGAKLRTTLIEETFRELGSVLYNLYGTSEAGLNFIATSTDLRYSQSTIGKKISGMRIKILDDNKKEVENGKVGQFWINNDWSMSNRKDSWIQTGDLGYRDDNFYYYLCGRTDDMVVSGGENVYPIEVEQVLIKHPLIEDAVVIGIKDKQFGQRLKAIVLPVKNAGTTEEEILELLRSRVSRFQLPKQVEIVDHMPYTSLGKLDKKQLE